MNYEIDVYDNHGKGKIILRLCYFSRTPEDEPIQGRQISPYEIGQDRSYPVIVDRVTTSTAFYGKYRLSNWNGIIIKAHLVHEKEALLQI